MTHVTLTFHKTVYVTDPFGAVMLDEEGKAITRTLTTEAKIRTDLDEDKVRVQDLNFAPFGVTHLQMAEPFSKHAQELIQHLNPII